MDSPDARLARTAVHADVVQDGSEGCDEIWAGRVSWKQKHVNAGGLVRCELVRRLEDRSVPTKHNPAIWPDIPQPDLVAHDLAN